MFVSLKDNNMFVLVFKYLKHLPIPKRIKYLL